VHTGAAEAQHAHSLARLRGRPRPSRVPRSRPTSWPRRPAMADGTARPAVVTTPLDGVASRRARRSGGGVSSITGERRTRLTRRGGGSPSGAGGRRRQCLSRWRRLLQWSATSCNGMGRRREVRRSSLLREKDNAAHGGGSHR
jgi:hypothetical protein